MPRLILLGVILLFAMLPACGAGNTGLAETKIAPEKVHDNEMPAHKGPTYPAEPGVQELGNAALACFNRALAHNPIFARGGAMVVHWQADANGDLLSLDFTRDSFGDWELDAEGETMAGCISRKVEHATIRWSASGDAPLRFSPEPTSQPAAKP